MNRNKRVTKLYQIRKMMGDRQADTLLDKLKGLTRLRGVKLRRLARQVGESLPSHRRRFLVRWGWLKPSPSTWSART